MIPDTSVYMIAGFAVILGGIMVYITSLVMRLVRIKQQTVFLEKVVDDQGHEDGKLTSKKYK